MKLWKLILPIAALLLPVGASALDLPRVVSTEWLDKNGSDPSLRILDIRKPEEFKAGHVPGSVNVFYGSLAVTRDQLANQPPEAEDLADLLRASGIDKNTPVVVVGKVDTTTDQVNNTRIAWTLRYVGLSQVGVLDGGMNKWAAENKTVSTEAAKVQASKADFQPNAKFPATKAEVSSKLGKAVVVDSRMPEFFFGIAKIPLVAREGRLPQSVNLPSAWIFTKEGTFKPTAELQAMVSGVVGDDKSAEIITYCDTGRLATGWWFVLSEVLGYQNVKMYDGSAQEWAADASMPMVRYSWK
jgi:thiosulfate/3-mercaptopyruvate sulfurtransferase